MPEEYTVEQGDCIHSIAFDRGFFPDTVWNDPGNAKLRSKRKDPHLLLPGDVVTIPDKRVSEVEKPTEQKHRFRRKGVPKFLRVRFVEVDNPLAHRPYIITIDGTHGEGNTDGDGWLKHPIPPNAREARILIDGAEYRFALGHLDPIDEVAGVQGRLRSLGHYKGPIDGVMSQGTIGALKAFQGTNGLDPTGKIDEQTKSLLKKLSGI